MLPMTHRSIVELNQIHRQFEDLFNRHQVAILQNDFKEAAKLLGHYEKSLFLHMKEEEEILLPLYRKKAPAIRGGDPDIFAVEHKKIIEWLNRLKLRLRRAWGHSLDPEDPNLVIALLDDEAQFKKYMEHHTLREDHIFYPEVDRLIGEKDRIHLLRLLTFSLEEMAES